MDVKSESGVFPRPFGPEVGEAVGSLSARELWNNQWFLMGGWLLQCGCNSSVF